MTRGRLKEGVYALIGEHPGNRYSRGDWEKVNAVIDERLLSFSERTLCIWDGAISLTVTAAGGAVRNLRDVSATVGKIVVRPYAVYIDGELLSRCDGGVDPMGMVGLVGSVSNLPTATTGKPRAWVWQEVDRIRLYPTPDATYSNSAIAGWVGHAPISTAGEAWATSSAADAADNVDVPTELAPELEHWVAAGLVVASQRPDLYAGLLAMAEAGMDRFRQAQLARWEGPMVRGGRNVYRSLA